MVGPSNKYLFNFSSSHTGGGLKILKSYMDLFESKGGVWFILNKKLESTFGDKYSKNKIFFVEIKKFKRFFDDEYYLKPIIKDLPTIELYFSYGIPVYSKVGQTNWFHVSNMIPICPEVSHLGWFSMLQMLLLGHWIRKNRHNADVISADSQDAVNRTLEFLSDYKGKTTVLRNGIDGSFIKLKTSAKSKTAVTIGTQKYKDLVRLYSLFKQLKSKGEVEELKVIGSEDLIPANLKSDSSVKLMGQIPHEKVVEELAIQPPISQPVPLKTPASPLWRASISALHPIFQRSDLTLR